MDAAKKEFELVISGMSVSANEMYLLTFCASCAKGKYLEVGPSGRKVCFLVLFSVSFI